MRIFGSDRLSGLMKRLGMEEGVPIEHRWVTKSIERAQTQVEGRNFDTRKHLLEYDDVMNKQRAEIYRLRKEILTGTLSRDYVVALAEDVSEDYVDRHCPAGKDPSEWTWDAFEKLVFETYGFKPSEKGLGAGDTNTELKDKLRTAVRETYEAKEKAVGAQTLRDFEKFFMLQTVDTLWKDHLLALDHLKEGIGLRGYGQRDPLVEYKRESFQLFEAMKEGVEEQILQYLFRFEVAEAPVERVPRPREAEPAPAIAATSGSAASRRAASDLEKRAKQKEQNLELQGSFDPTAGGDFDVSTVKATGPKVGRNEPCPCGSGKKYKKCHGATGMGAAAG
jgi:preprotein translocase subunit SecA